MGSCQVAGLPGNDRYQAGIGKLASWQDRAAGSTAKGDNYDGT